MSCTVYNVLLAFALTVAPAAAQETWGGLSFGMTLDDAKRALGGNFRRAAESGVAAHALATVRSCRGNASLSFGDHGLERVLIMIFASDCTNRTDSYSLLSNAEEQLIQRYGAPTIRDTSLGPNRIFRGPRQGITLDGINTSTGFVKIEYVWDGPAVSQNRLAPPDNLVKQFRLIGASIENGVPDGRVAEMLAEAQVALEEEESRGQSVFTDKLRQTLLLYRKRKTEEAREVLSSIEDPKPEPRPRRPRRPGPLVR